MWQARSIAGTMSLVMGAILRRPRHSATTRGSASARLRSAVRRDIPRRDRAGDQKEERVRFGTTEAPKSGQPRRISDLQLRLEVCPLVVELPGSGGNRLDTIARGDLCCVESVPASARFGMYCLQIGRDRIGGRGRVSETEQLRMVRVAASLPSKYRLREQGLAPERDKSASIEVFGVQGPEAHERA
jgi:hypothetical protein